MAPGESRTPRELHAGGGVHGETSTRLAVAKAATAAA